MDDVEGFRRGRYYASTILQEAMDALGYTPEQQDQLVTAMREADERRSPTIFFTSST